MRRLPILYAALAIVALSIAGLAQPKKSRASTSAGAIPAGVLLQIIKAEDERRWNDDLGALLADKDAQVRRRAVLAAGRIGDDKAIPTLAEMLLTDRDTDVRQMAAFALGEIES
ncbi:MAG: HEAT repeat domain-containing protein, partial [Pyrinomonadaceae bacterium]